MSDAKRAGTQNRKETNKQNTFKHDHYFQKSEKEFGPEADGVVITW